MPSTGAKTGCNVKIVVQEDTTPNNVHMVVIDGVNYKNGNTVTLSVGMHSLEWASGDGGVFDSWSCSGNLSVSDPSSESTELEVTCGGTLTLNLVACPSGEQIVNGGFETGDFTGWDVGWGEVVTDHPHTGTYCMHLSYQEYREQTLAEPILVECIKSFVCWIYGQDALGQHSNAEIRITYSDDTTTVFTQDAPDGSWSKVDILSQLTAGKYVKSIRIKSWVDIAWNLWVDDVSIIGNG